MPDSLHSHRHTAPDSADVASTRRGVVASLSVNLFETLALAIVSGVSGSVALRAQAASNAADVAVQVFLLIGLVSSARTADETHPLGYGRERFFWSLLAALGIFFGGGVVALQSAVSAALHPSPIAHYALGYAVLAATLILDAVAWEIALRPLRAQAHSQGVSLWLRLQTITDPASKTVVIGGGCALLGGVIAAIGLVVSQQIHSATPDTVASTAIGLLLLLTSGLLLRMNRELLSGQGVSLSVMREMRAIVIKQHGVLDVPDLFAILVGPSSLIVNGDITFADDQDVETVEQTIMRAAAALRDRWPAIDYVYLTPVGTARQRRGPWPRHQASRSDHPRALVGPGTATGSDGVSPSADTAE